MTLFWGDKAESKTTWPLALARCKGVAPHSSATIPDYRSIRATKESLVLFTGNCPDSDAERIIKLYPSKIVQFHNCVRS